MRVTAVSIVCVLLFVITMLVVYFRETVPVVSKAYSSPDELMRAVYTSYFQCMKTAGSQKGSLLDHCIANPGDFFDGTFVKTLKATPGDTLLCNEGIPKKINIFKPYLDSSSSATVIVETVFTGGNYHIPVRLHKAKYGWLIYEIDCNLDGHID